MQLVTAIIKPFKVDDVIAALVAADVGGVTVTEVRGFGRQGGHVDTYRGAEYNIAYVPKLRIDVAAADGDADRVVETIRQAAATGRIGDGKIWVTPLERVIRLRTGEEGADAV